MCEGEISPVLGDRGIGLGRAVEFDHVPLHDWLGLHRQIDQGWICMTQNTNQLSAPTFIVTNGNRGLAEY